MEELDALDETEEDELLRGIDFRGIKTPLTSSEFIEFRDWPPPPLIPHAGRLMLEKLGGLATAVMRKGWSRRSVWGRDGRQIQVSRYACSLARRLFGLAPI